ncbi:MAG: DUF4168 domain-containing protein [Pseudohongiellaceae bacterium]
MSIKQIMTKGLVFSLMLGMGATVATAQPAGEPPAAPPQQSAGQNDFSDADLQDFADVQNVLQEIRTDYSARLEGTDDPQAAAELQQEATEQMMGALEDQGIEVDTYNAIAVALQSDQALRERFEEILN